MKRLVPAAFAMLLCTMLTPANIARPEPIKTPKPKPSKSVVTAMDIRLDRDATEARLIVPRSQLKQLRAELDGLDDADDATAAVSSPGISRTQTMMSGAFLSLALVFGGMWFIRSGKAANKNVKMLVIGVTAATLGSAATFVYANAGPPSEARKITGKMFSPAVHIYGFGWGEVRVETSNQDRIQLIVPNPREDRPTGEE